MIFDYSELPVYYRANGGPSVWTVQSGYFEEQQASLYTGTAFHLSQTESLAGSSQKSSATKAKPVTPGGLLHAEWSSRLVLGNTQSSLA